MDSKLVRGLDYYSKTAFEFISDEIGAKAAIAGAEDMIDLLNILMEKVVLV